MRILIPTPPEQWDWIWKAPGHPRIQHFLWLCCHGVVLAASFLSLRGGLRVDSMCQLCKQSEEDPEHILRSCPMAAPVWQAIQIPATKKASFRVGLKEWI